MYVSSLLDDDEVVTPPPPRVVMPPLSASVGAETRKRWRMQESATPVSDSAWAVPAMAA